MSAWSGGVAYGGGTASGSVSVAGSNYFWNGETNSTRVGWTVGAGAELAVTNNVIIRAEYLYYDLGSADLRAYGNSYVVNHPAFNGVYLATKQTIAGSVARIGVDYKF